MQKMDDMDINQILEIPDTPDRLAAMQKPNWRSGPSVNLEESVRDSYSHCLRNSGLCNVAGSSSSNPEDDIDHLFRQANLACKISEVLDMKCCSPKTQATGTEAKPSVVSCESGGSEKITNFSKKSLFPASYSTQCRDSGRKNGNEPSTEHGSDSLVQTQEDFVFKDDHVFNERSEEIIDLSGKTSPSRLCYSTQCRDDYAIVRTQGKVFELIDLSSQRSPLSSSYPTQSTDLRRMNGKDPCSVSDGSSGPESGKADAFDRHYIASRHRDKGKKIDLRSNSRANMEPVQLIVLQPNMSQGNMGKRRLVQNSCISPCNIGKRNTSAELDCENIIDSGETFLSFLGTSNQNKDKGIDSSNNMPPERSQACIRQSDCEAPPRSTRQKRLVRNGCISPFNLVKSKNATKLKDVGTNGLKEFPDASSSRQLQILCPSAEGILADKRKGKVTLDGHLAAELQESIATSSSERVCLTSGKDLTITKDINDNCLVFSENTEWRTARNRTGLNPSQGGSSSELERENSKHHGLRNQLKGKRKCSVLRSRAGENSSSSFEDSEISYLQSSRQHSSSNSTENTNAWPNRGRLAPIIEVDELLSPAGRYSSPERQSYRLSDESGARSKQVESDEMLARQLQEEFYLELGGVGSSEEIDASVAWSLQHQEDAQHAASFAMRSPSHSGHASVAHSYADPFPASLFQNSFATSTAHAQVPARNRLAQLRRQFISNEIDPETRFDFLEAFEAVFDSTNNRPISSVFQVQHDFNVDDYEMLLSLDDNNHQHRGASDHQINSLPQSVVQSDSNAEPCAICLENPSVGDVVRHLPCLHKFHKECIDIWLRRKTSCPICKSGIT